MRTDKHPDTAQPQYLLIALPENRKRVTSRRPNLVKTFKRSVVALLLAIVAFTSGGVSAAPINSSNANPFDVVGGIQDFICGYTPHWAPPLPTPWPGIGLLAEVVIPDNPKDAAIDTLIPISRFSKFATPYGDRSVTAEEWYGTAGMRWVNSNYEAVDGVCLTGIIREAIGGISGLWWTLVVLIGSIGLNIFEFATSISAFDFFIDTVADVIGDLNAALYTQYLLPVVMLGALWMGWQGLVKRRSSEAVQGAIWMIGATAAAAVFFAQPGFIAKEINKVVTGIQDILIETVSSAGASGTADGEGPCSVEAEEDDLLGKRSTRVTKCALWYTFLFTPWAEGQFADARGQLTVDRFYPAAGGDAVYFGSDEAPVPSIGKGKPLTDFAGPGQPGIPIEWLQLDSWSFNHDEALTLDTDAQSKKYNQWHAVAQRMAKSPGGTGAENNLRDWQPDIDEAAEDPTWFTPPGANQWSNFDVMHRFLIAILALVAMIAAAGPIMFISLILVIQEIGFIFLLFFTPIFLLIGIHPGAGRRIAMNWLEQILSLSLKRIGNALVLGVLLTMVAAIIGADAGSWFIQILLIGCVSAAAIVFRKRIVDGISQVNLGGAGADFGQQATSSLRRGTSSTVNSAANTASQLAGGQAGGGLINTIVGGAVAGAGGAALLSAGRRKGDSQRIGDKTSKEENEYNEWFEESVVGKAEMDEYKAQDDQKLRQRERFAMKSFTGDPDQIQDWQDWATKYGQKLEDGTFIPRAIPRPEDPELAQMLRDSGLTLYEDLEEAADKILAGAKDSAKVNADGKKFLAPIERPANMHPVVEAKLKAGGAVFVDDMEKSVKEWQQWSISGEGGEDSPRAIPAYATKNPHFREMLEAAGVSNFEEVDDRPTPGRHASPESPQGGVKWNAGAGSKGGRHRADRPGPVKPDLNNLGGNGGD